MSHKMTEKKEEKTHWPIVVNVSKDTFTTKSYYNV